MGILSRIFGSTEARSTPEGSYYPGPYLVDGGWLPAGTPWNYWQLGQDVMPYTNSAMVEACVSAYAQTVAMCPGNHLMKNERGGMDRVTNSALSRILRQPNPYQNISEFLLNGVSSLYIEGNAYAVAFRNQRNEISELHWMDPRHCHASVAPVSRDDGWGGIFYSLSGNPIVEAQIPRELLRFVPARDVLHLKLRTNPSYPLEGLSPMLAFALSQATSNAMMRQQLAFYTNQARPSIVLSTERQYTKEQVEVLRQKWNDQSSGLNAGKTPILTDGLKPIPISTSPEQAQLAELMKYTEQQIALAFRVPLQILGINTTPGGPTRALIEDWKSGGLGFCLNHIEEAFGKLFGLKGVPDEYMELDTSILLRSSERERMDTHKIAISGGVRTINESRELEGLPRIEGGDDIRIQQQDVPLDWHDKQLPKPAAPPAPAQEPEEEDADADDAREWTASLLRAADEHERAA
jgi:HK97 family phage portal protein